MERSQKLTYIQDIPRLRGNVRCRIEPSSYLIRNPSSDVDDAHKKDHPVCIVEHYGSDCEIGYDGGVVYLHQAFEFM